jgi:Zn-dependent peptidase ImmA (M78 family)
MPVTPRQKPDYNRAMDEARRLLNQFGLVEPPIDPVKIAQNLGIKVNFVTLSADNRNVSGFYDPADNAIYVNEAEYPKRQTFTIAHELGHALLHRDWAKSEDYKVLMRDPDADTSDPIEKEANAFAAHLLVPRHMLAKYWDKMAVPSLSEMFAVSSAMIGYRISREFDESNAAV